MNLRQLTRIAGTKAQQDAQQLRAIANRILFLKRTTNLSAEERKDVRKYVAQDYARMERGNAGDWCLIGIRAEAEYSVGTSRNGYLAQEITSGGLWGIESDSEESYLKSVEDEELTDLSVQLKGIGFSGRAIAAAFKNVEREGC